MSYIDDNKLCSGPTYPSLRWRSRTAARCSNDIPRRRAVEPNLLLLGCARHFCQICSGPGKRAGSNPYNTLCSEYRFSANVANLQGNDERHFHRLLEPLRSGSILLIRECRRSQPAIYLAGSAEYGPQSSNAGVQQLGPDCHRLANAYADWLIKAQFLRAQEPHLYYPTNVASDTTFGGYNIAEYNPYGSVNNVITDWNLVRGPAGLKLISYVFERTRSRSDKQVL